MLPVICVRKLSIFTLRRLALHPKRVKFCQESVGSNQSIWADLFDRVFSGCLNFWGLHNFLVNFHYKGHDLNLLISIVQRATALKKNGVLFCQKSKGAVRCSLARRLLCLFRRQTDRNTQKSQSELKNLILNSVCECVGITVGNNPGHMHDN